MWLGLSLYVLTAAYIVFCLCSTGTQYRFNGGSLLCLALDIPFVALRTSILPGPTETLFDNTAKVKDPVSFWPYDALHVFSQRASLQAFAAL